MGNKQSTPSGFGSKSTSTEVLNGIDLSQKHAFVTGCNTGIGKNTVLELYRNGCKVTMACRDKAKMLAAKQDIEKQIGKTKGELRTTILDLSSLESVKNCAKEYLDSDDKNDVWNKIDMLILNAGIMACPESKSKDGMELQLAVNHFGHFALTNLLLDRINEPGRIVVLSSSAHRWAPKKDVLEDLNYEKSSYSKFTAYGRSKLANIWFARELSKKLKASKKNITVNAVHPGVIGTDLSRHMGFFLIMMASIMSPFLKSIPQGAATTCYVATNPKLNNETGKYFYDCNIQNTTAQALDDKEAAKLWKISEQFTKINYPY